MRADEYRRYAAACLEAAQEANDPDIKAMHTDMASAWLRLEELAGKYALLDLVYDAYPPPER